MHGSGFDCDNKYQHFSNGKGFDLNQEYPGLKSLFGENIKKLEEERANLILYHYKISIDFLRLEIQYLADLNLLSLGFVGFVFVLFVKHSLQQNEFRPLFVDRNIPDVFVGLSLVSALGFNLIAFTDIHKTLNFMSTQTFDANVICYTNFQHTLSKIFYGILVSFALPLACIAGFSPLQKVLAKD